MLTNQVLLGDCLEILKNIDNNFVDLIYLDPPFFTQKTHKLSSKDNSREYSFEDNWENISEYQNYIKKRLVECRRVLKTTGSIFLHCDKSASHYLRFALDEVFGFENFQSEIIWTYRRWSNSKKGLLNSHQTIFFYSKTKDFKFNQKYEDYSPSTNLDQIFQERERDKNGKSKYKTDQNGEIVFSQTKKGVPISDTWDIPFLNPKAKERVGYPTQKPILLLEKIIELVTDKDDFVLDPFCGSGTTLVASKLLNRQFLGIDKSEEAIQLAKQRLKNPFKTNSNLLQKGRKTYLNQDSKTLEILKKIGAVPVQRNKGIDGFLSQNGQIQAIPIRIQKPEESLEMAKLALIKATKNTNYQKIILLAQQNSKEQVLFNQNLEDENILVFFDLEKLPTQNHTQ
jgi:site-specific DNA-methyltransferase (adenine-specific)